ncbi:MAG: hypothetical protein KGP14_11855 [Betaproteobacteria bacterium]|nr:hypothetical protein [Betaproteobacteria bacterium]
MNANLWSLPKDRPLLVSLDERADQACDVAPGDSHNPCIVTLRHTEPGYLATHVYLHSQRSGTYGVFFEYPHTVPDILEAEGNLPLPAAQLSLTMHFDA